MILSSQLIFSDDQAITATAISTNVCRSRECVPGMTAVSHPVFRQASSSGCWKRGKGSYSYPGH